MKKNNIIVDIVFYIMELILILIPFLIEDKFSGIILAIIAIFISSMVFVNEHGILNYILPKRDINPIYLFIILSFMGTSSILVHYIFGGFYRPHHIIGNTAALPLLVVICVEELKKLNKNYNIFEYFMSEFSGVIMKTTIWIAQLCLLYVISFENMYVHRDMSISKELNEIYLTISFFIVVLWLIYLLLFLLLQRRNKEYKFELMFPYKPIVCIGYFLLVWSYLCYYEADHKMEYVYYISIIIYEIMIWVLYILCILKTKYSKKELIKATFFSLFVSIIFIFYGIVVAILQETNSVKNHDNNYYYMVVGMTFILLFFIILFAYVPELFKDIKDSKSN